ncbi:Membrane protein, MarC family [Candidatus Rhodobacter oscarellae]|uniref:UPF0056 membrane protein n=1 Tax=Candidatus Rhodobacter oscarellae TaxID=1675527 RepID=A0A0J9GV39_9RHOB|nr:MarC family protein [Candidatus Rhodobacter lobularis]KMW57443.1 Membrane protein, MarC family [Candidatus Rhodobacter lobularis]
MDPIALLTVFTALFVIIDPIGLAPLFVALTQGMSAKARRRIALRACFVALALLTLFGLLGDALLGAVGISMPAFRIAGGILLFLTALDMLFERRTKRRKDRADEDDPSEDPSVFPLALPLIAGPGAMATMVLLAGAPGTPWETVLGVHLAMLGVIALVFVLFLTAGTLERILGPTGIMVVTRLLGMLLAALSVQFVVDGAADLGLVMAPKG